MTTFLVIFYLLNLIGMCFAFPIANKEGTLTINQFLLFIAISFVTTLLVPLGVILLIGYISIIWKASGWGNIVIVRKP